MSKFQQIAELENNIESLEKDISNIATSHYAKDVTIKIVIKDHLQSWNDDHITADVLKTVVLRQLRAERDILKEKRKKLIGNLNVPAKKKRWWH